MPTPPFSLTATSPILGSIPGLDHRDRTPRNLHLHRTHSSPPAPNDSRSPNPQPHSLTKQIPCLVILFVFTCRRYPDTLHTMPNTYDTMHPLYATSTWSYRGYQRVPHGMVRVPTHEIRVTGVLDGHDADAVELSGGGTEVNVGAVVVVDRGLGPEPGSAGAQVHAGTDGLPVCPAFDKFALTAWRSTRARTCGAGGSSSR